MTGCGSAAGTKERLTFASVLILTFIKIAALLSGLKLCLKPPVLFVFGLAALWSCFLANPPAKSASFDAIRGKSSPKSHWLGVW